MFLKKTNLSYFFLAVLEFVLRDPCLLDRYSTLPLPLAFFCFNFFFFFLIGSCFFAWGTPDHDPPTYTSFEVRTTAVYYYIQIICLGEVLAIFVPELFLNCDPQDLPPLGSSWDYRCASLLQTLVIFWSC
jgi:hypothetical protein